MEQLPLPQLKVEIVIKGKTFASEFPDNGQFLEIERRKGTLTTGIATNTASGLYAKTIGDTIATYTILFPELMSSLNVKTALDLKPMDTKELITSYVQVYLPWYNAWLEQLNSFEEKIS